MARAPAARRGTGIARWSRGGVVVLAWLFAAGVVVQVFLAGLSVFDSPARWPDHVAFGRLLGLIPPPLILLALAGRLPLGLIVMAALVLVMYGMQYLFANTGAAYLAAFHPVNAFVLLGLSAQLGQRTRRMMVPPAPSEESARRAAEGRITR